MNVTKLALRVKGIFDCAWFGILPYQIYERKCHYIYDCDYKEHLYMNCKYALEFAFDYQSWDDLRNVAKTKKYFWFQHKKRA